MDIRQVRTVCFSPTGTTRAIVEEIVRGICGGLREGAGCAAAPCAVELVDVTRPDARLRPLRTSADELLVAAPVYMGRVPALLDAWLRAIRGQGTPAVCVVVYGNRTYGDALLELRDILAACGCVPVACAAYIGEHSFSGPETPVAAGRPDAEDIRHAERFGRKVAEKLRSFSPAAPEGRFPAPDAFDVPGERPYRGETALWSVDFIAVGDTCTQCGLCAQVCPVGAVDPARGESIDRALCVTCCACVRRCPRSARTMKEGPVRDAAVRLNRLYGERKEPECFL